MNELLRALGLEFYVNEISIKIQTFKIFYPSSSGPVNNTIGSIYNYQPYYVPTVVWSFTTEFGQALDNYNRKNFYTGQQQAQITYPWGGLTTTGAGLSQQQALYPALQQSQQMQQLSQQHAAAQSQLSQGQYRLTSSGAISQGQLLLQSPTASVVIKNIDSDEDKTEFSLFSKIKRLFKWTS